MAFAANDGIVFAEALRVQHAEVEEANLCTNEFLRAVETIVEPLVARTV